ncbi:unnamed protein product [Acanthoscelides obtectus]|uniref:Uncharacterized protein n=1 Tax=Acanthoscelides obtectus TaxID=200917 RepID=A0A9P0LRB7_ACAOB|nr:unnamed protein product [Acanthoscelides obtectus]CAK1626393.1 hypothetical protein AOBTE_LOCUS3817 [Acanthoscelides obtectus]
MGRDFKNVEQNPFISGDSHRVEIGKKSPQTRPRARRKYIIAPVILVIVIVILVLAFTTNVFSKKTHGVLVPPNPTKPLPPSASTLHVMDKGAICADGPPCAEIGK